MLPTAVFDVHQKNKGLKMTEPKSTKLYCHKIKKYYRHFYNSKFKVGLCSNENYPIVSVIVREALENEESNYWAWWINKEEYFTYIYFGKISVELCFAYGYKVKEEQGEGKLLRVVIEEQEEKPTT